MFVTRTVLLVDDNSGSREELREILRHAGYMVLGEARNTDDALDKFMSLEPDAVIMDVTILGTIDPLVTIQRMHRLRPPSVIFATGSPSQSQVMMEALTMGAVDFFMKPFQQRTVHTCLQRHLG